MADQDVRWLTLGRLVGAHGVQGEVRVQTFTETPERLLEFPAWHLKLPSGSPPRKVSVVSGRRQGEKVVVVRLAEVTSREDAQRLSGVQVLIERTLLPEPAEGDYYWADLEGCRVVSEQGEELGRVQAMMATGANDVMILTTPDAGERLLPFTRDVVKMVDLPQQIVTVALMPGL
ncbi:MAG: ribosome maturation factor RimM [Magnetococcus sp. DMHC-1]|nr:16S rRNA processing protein RimM [Magnetococcales bacterium]